MFTLKKVVTSRLQSAVRRDRNLNKQYIVKHSDLYEALVKKQALEQKIAKYMAMEKNEEILHAVYDMGLN